MASSSRTRAGVIHNPSASTSQPVISSGAPLANPLNPALIDAGLASHTGITRDQVRSEALDPPIDYNFTLCTEGLDLM